MKATNRGFTIYAEVPDMYGGVVRVQESSNIEGGVWIFYDHPQNEAIMVPHLSDEQAVKVAIALLQYANGDRA